MIIESEHFRDEEFTCKCGCEKIEIDDKLILALEDIRSHFEDRSIIITSGYRCQKHNEEIGGSDTSKHMAGLACDFIVKGVHEDDVVEYLEKKYKNKYGIGRYTGRTHIDVRQEKARWDSREA